MKLVVKEVPRFLFDQSEDHYEFRTKHFTNSYDHFREKERKDHDSRSLKLCVQLGSHEAHRY